MIQIRSRLNLIKQTRDAINIKMGGQALSTEMGEIGNADFNMTSAATAIIPITTQWIPFIAACIPFDFCITSNH